MRRLASFARSAAPAPGVELLPRSQGGPAGSLRSLRFAVRRAGSALLLLLALTTAARAQSGADLEAAVTDVAEKGRERTVLIYGVIGLGSGAVVDMSGTVVTNAHVVAGARYALVQQADGTRTMYRQRGIDYTRDLAVLEPVEPVRGRACFDLAPARPRAGAWVVALGFPGGLSTNERPTVSLGRVLEGEGDAAAPGGAPMLDYSAALRHDAPIFSGNSGGPLVDLEGRLVGINGAVDLQRAVSLTIPVETVAERLVALSGGAIVLPGGIQLDARNPAVQALYRLLDPFARQLPERVAEGSSRLVEAADALPALPLPGQDDMLAGDRLAAEARKQPRQALLDRMAGARAGWVVRLAGDRLATQIDTQHAVCKASWLPGGDALPREVALHDGRKATLIAIHAPDDLALLRLPDVVESSPRDAMHRPVGTLVFAQGAGGPLASGILSVAPRRASGALAAQVSGGGLPAPVLRAIEALKQLAERFNVDALKQLVEQLEVSLEARQAFAAGTPPRGYGRVLAIDAPVTPSHVGGPVVDRAGDLVGVTIGVPHHGTTYVVPIARVRAAFMSTIGGTPLPERLGNAKLY